MQGTYPDVNEQHLTTSALGDLVVSLAPPRKGFTLAELAVLAMALSAAIYALIPVALEFFGSDWKAGRPEREAANRERAKEVELGAR